jgi:hypothetical protein
MSLRVLRVEKGGEIGGRLELVEKRSYKAGWVLFRNRRWNERNAILADQNCCEGIRSLSPAVTMGGSYGEVA